MKIRRTSADQANIQMMYLLQESRQNEWTPSGIGCGHSIFICATDDQKAAEMRSSSVLIEIRQQYGLVYVNQRSTWNVPPIASSGRIAVDS
jgi:hypothetical protein